MSKKQLNNIAPFPAARAAKEQIYLVRREMELILTVYGRLLRAGRWKDYAIMNRVGYAAFAMMKRSGDVPEFQVIKDPALENKQGMWRIINSHGHILKRGHNLKTLLGYFDRFDK